MAAARSRSAARIRCCGSRWSGRGCTGGGEAHHDAEEKGTHLSQRTNHRGSYAILPEPALCLRDLDALAIGVFGDLVSPIRPTEK